MVNKNLINYRAAACATFIAFFFFSLQAGLQGYAFQRVKEEYDDGMFTASSFSPDKLEDHMYLYYTVAVCVAGSSLFYLLYLAAELYTGLFLRVIVLTCSMVIFVGAIADGESSDDFKSSDNLDKDAFRDFDSGDWAHICFGLAWVFIASFELNQMLSKDWGRFVSKIQVFFFYALISTAAIIKGVLLLDEDKDFVSAYDPSVHGKIWLAFGGLAALATLAFMFYMCIDHSEPLKLHMIFATLTALTWFACEAYEYHQWRKDWSVSMDLYVALGKTATVDFLEFQEEIKHYMLAGNVFLGLSMLCIVGFNAYFLETQEKADEHDLRGPASV